MRTSTACTLIVALLTLPVQAGETAWQEVAPGVSVRLISEGKIDASGKTLVALEIDMPENTKTYWRVPGETGLPTELDFSHSTGIHGYEQLWPYPLRDEDDGYLDYVYYGHTVLPVELDVSGADAKVDVNVTLGICSDICVPAQTRLELPLNGDKADMGNGLRIRQALAEVPIAWDSITEPAGPIELSTDGTSIQVEIDSAVIDPESLIIAGNPGAPLFGTPQKSPQGDLVLLPIMGKTDNSVLDGLEVEMSFMTPTGAYEISRTIEAGDEAIVETAAQ